MMSRVSAPGCSNRLRILNGQIARLGWDTVAVRRLTHDEPISSIILARLIGLWIAEQS